MKRITTGVNYCGLIDKSTKEPSPCVVDNSPSPNVEFRHCLLDFLISFLKGDYFTDERNRSGTFYSNLRFTPYFP